MGSAVLVTIIILLPIAVFIAIVVMRSRKRSEQRKTEMLRAYREIVVNDDLKIIDEHILDNKLFALDPNKRVFVYIDNYDKPVYDIVHLNGMSGCKLEKKGPNVYSKSNGKSVVSLHVNEIYISFMSHDEVATSFCIYSEMRDGQDQFLLLSKIGDDWQQKLHRLIKTSSEMAK